jgi:hypothetical protein
MSIGQFYWLVLKTAFSGRFWYAEKIAGGVGLFLAFALWYYPVPGWEAAVNWLPFLVFAGVFASVVVVRLVVAPWKIYSDEASSNKIAKEKLTPRLSLSIFDDVGSDLHFGSTSTTIGGRQTTVMTASLNVLRVSCKNLGAFRALGCEAHLVDAKRINDDGTLIPLGFTESLGLSWSRNLRERQFSVDIQPGISKAIYVLVAMPNRSLRIFRENDVPLEYHQLLSEPTKYRLWIQASAIGVVASEICIDVWASPVEKGILIDSCEVRVNFVDPLQRL